MSKSSISSTTTLANQHLLIGWSGLFLFLMLGIALEAMHGLKLPFYLDLRNATRRLMLTLAHTHGTLFSLVHIAFALTLTRFEALNPASLRRASKALNIALILMPLGFALGGIWLYGGDPGVGVFLVPFGALALLFGVGSFLFQLRSQTRREGKTTKPSKKSK